MDRRNFLKTGAAAALGLSAGAASANTSSAGDKIKFRGVMTALITPVDANGNVKKNVVAQLIEHNLKAGIKGFYVAGGTGEGAVLQTKQRRDVAEAAAAANKKRGKIIIQVGSIHAAEAIELTRHANEIGADAVSSILPSLYFGYNIDELCDYYKKICDNTDLPVFAYVNKIGVGTDANAMIDRLMKIKNFIGAKDTRANYFQLWQLKQLNNGNINVLNGPDESLLCGLAMGADGGIGTTYGFMPDRFVELYRRFKAGDIAGAQEMQAKINRVIAVFFKWADGNGIRPTKEIFKLMGFDAGGAMPPAREYSAAKAAAFKKDLVAAGLEL